MFVPPCDIKCRLGLSENDMPRCVNGRCVLTFTGEEGVTLGRFDSLPARCNSLLLPDETLRMSLRFIADRLVMIMGPMRPPVDDRRREAMSALAGFV